MKIKKKILKIVICLAAVFLVLFFAMRLFSYAEDKSSRELLPVAEGTVIKKSQEKYSELADYSCPDCNLIFIIVETLRADHIGAYGYGRNTTPNIDKLAREGIFFENFIAQSSWITPTTATLLSGIYPEKHGAYKVGRGINEGIVLLPQILKEHGFDTYGFNPSGRAGAKLGFDRGFDSYFDFFDLKYESADQMNKEILPFIEARNKKAKQFLFIRYSDPHAEYAPKERTFSKNNKREWLDVTSPFSRKFLELSNSAIIRQEVVQHIINLYDDEILFTDKQIERLLSLLKEKGLYENSIIVVMSDYGESFGNHNLFSHGRFLYDDLLKVPWIMRLPDKFGAGIRVKKQVSQIDVLPTVLSLLGILSPDEVDGIDVLREPEELFTYSYSNYLFEEKIYTSYAIRNRDEKLTINLLETNDLDVKPLPGYSSTVWVKDEYNVNIVEPPVSDYDLALKSFYGIVDINLEVDGQFFKTLSVGPKAIPVDLPKDAKSLRLVSLSPCTKLSDIGLFEDMRCFSFGFIILQELVKGIEKNKFIGLQSDYYQLDNDPEEEKDIYDLDKHKKRIEYLESKLLDHIKEMKRPLLDKG